MILLDKRTNFEAACGQPFFTFNKGKECPVIKKDYCYKERIATRFDEKEVLIIDILELREIGALFAYPDKLEKCHR